MIIVYEPASLSGMPFTIGSPQTATPHHEYAAICAILPRALQFPLESFLSCHIAAVLALFAIRVHEVGRPAMAPPPHWVEDTSSSIYIIFAAAFYVPAPHHAAMLFALNRSPVFFEKITNILYVKSKDFAVVLLFMPRDVTLLIELEMSLPVSARDIWEAARFVPAFILAYPRFSISWC